MPISIHAHHLVETVLKFWHWANLYVLFDRLFCPRYLIPSGFSDPKFDSLKWVWGGFSADVFYFVGFSLCVSKLYVMFQKSLWSFYRLLLSSHIIIQPHLFLMPLQQPPEKLAPIVASIASWMMASLQIVGKGMFPLWAWGMEVIAWRSAPMHLKESIVLATTGLLVKISFFFPRVFAFSAMWLKTFTSLVNKPQ